MNKPAPYVFPKIVSIISSAEKVILVLLAIGLITYYFTSNFFYIVQASLLLLIPTYFYIAFQAFNFYAYECKLEVKVFSEEEEEEEESDESETEIPTGNILFELIVPKVLWLCYATSLLSILFSTMNTGNKGYVNGLFTGAFCICAGLVIFLITYIKKESIYKQLGFILLRGVPILLVILYLLFY